MTNRYPVSVGEPDPNHVRGLHCMWVFRSGCVCTLPPMHTGHHVAHGSPNIVLEIQDNYVPDELKVSEGL